MHLYHFASLLAFLFSLALLSTCGCVMCARVRLWEWACLIVCESLCLYMCVFALFNPYLTMYSFKCADVLEGTFLCVCLFFRFLCISFFLFFCVFLSCFFLVYFSLFARFFLVVLSSRFLCVLPCL